MNAGSFLSTNTIYEIETVDETHWNVTETKIGLLCVALATAHICMWVDAFCFVSDKAIKPISSLSVSVRHSNIKAVEQLL